MAKPSLRKDENKSQHRTITHILSVTLTGLGWDFPLYK